MSDFKKRIVVKVGTNVMTNKNNRIVGPILKNLVRQIAYLYERDIITILVSSGSAIAGKEVLGDCDAKDATTRRQIFSSVGQPRMMRHYYSMFHDFGMRCAQILATKRDFAPGTHSFSLGAPFWIRIVTKTWDEVSRRPPAGLVF